MSCRLAAVSSALLVVGACATTEPLPPEVDDPSPGEHPSIGALFAGGDLMPPPEPDVCDLLPCDGACSVACDKDALSAYVPDGSCASFYCELTNGGVLIVDVCKPPE